MGKSSSVTVGFRYEMTLQMGLSIGPVDALTQIVAGGKLAWSGNLTSSTTFSIQNPGLFGGDKQEGGIQGLAWLCMGEADQQPNQLLTTLLGNTVPAYRGLVTLVYDGEVGSMSPYIKAWAFQVTRFTAGWRTPVWQPALCQVGQGMNGAHFIYRVITDPVTGLGKGPSTLDLDRMLSAAQTLHDEGMGLCLRWSRSDVLSNFINQIESHVGGIFVDDPTTGLQYLKLLRGDYDIDTVVQLDESNVLAVSSFDVGTISGSVNQVTVTYHDCNTNRDAAVTVQNPASVMAQGGRVINQSTTYQGIWNGDLGTRVAMRDLRSVSSLPARCKLKVKSNQQIRRGDVVAWSWKRYNITKMALRVLEIDRGEVGARAMTLTCSQDIFSLPDISYIVVQPPLWTSPSTAPEPITLQQMVEASYRDLAANLSQANLNQVEATAGYVCTLGARPTSNAYNYELWTRTGSNAFAKVSEGNFTPTTTTASAMPAEAGPTVVSVTASVDLARVNLNTEAMIDNELCRVVAIDTTNNTVTLARGCVDTVPVEHDSGARIWFTDDYTGADPTEYLTGETVYAKLLTIAGDGTLDSSLATVMSLTLNERQIRPYPPGNLKIQGTAYPAEIEGALALTWSHRDRLLQADQLIDTTSGNVGPEPDTTYTVRVYLNSVLDSTTTGVTATSLTPIVSGDGTAQVQIDAVRDGYTSWQSLSATFSYVRGQTRLTEDGDTRITEAGDTRILES